MRFLEEYTSVHRFLADVQTFLLSREAENCIQIGVTQRLAETPDPDTHAVLLTAKENHVVAGTAVWTPPQPMSLSRMPDWAALQIADACLRRPAQPESIFGPRHIVELFALRWRDTAGKKVVKERNQRIFEARKIIPPPPVAGSMRKARLEDKELIARWNEAFAHDTGEPAHAHDAWAEATHAIETQSRYVWEVDGSCVAMAGVSGRTPHGIRINWVYTPQEQRGKGYASHLVAAISQAMFDEGKELCFLYTDLANPAANGIYQKLGFKSVQDSYQVWFS